MSNLSIQALMDQLTPDPWRVSKGFSPEMATANAALWDSPDEIGAVVVLRDWLRRHQPCLFGRIAAKENLLSFCILTPTDLRSTDAEIRERIQAARTAWTREAFEGRKSGFVILALDRFLARATPNATVQALARRLSELYLLEEVLPDNIYLEDVFLEMPSFARTTWRWRAGVNYFSAHADGRWWQDHRIPGGIGLSINSVGHMAKAGQIGRVVTELATAAGAPGDGWLPTKIDSLHQALEFAMRTIALASDAVSGPATRLLPASSGTDAPGCPIVLPPNLEGRDCRKYEGYYHTDVTLPSAYFRPDFQRPAESIPITLDFTYLTEPGIENPDALTMGQGRRIRSVGGRASRTLPRRADRPRDAALKHERSIATVIDVAESARLVAAIDRPR